MDKLHKKLNDLIESLSIEKQAQIRVHLEDLVSVHPFNEYEYIISVLLGMDKILIDDYYQIRDEYIARNMYLYIFEISAPRYFGETWAQGHLKELIPDLVKPTKKLDNDYSGQYDFLLVYDKKNIRIEVKASRAVDLDDHGALYVKALASDSNKNFWMNFQQAKPACCDVFVLIVVWRDVIKYWILSSKEFEQNGYYSKGQHRGNVGEGQLHITQDNIREFDKYLCRSDKLRDCIVDAYDVAQ
ncbi:AseI [Candidatus Omnitrophus magneticus]|uniref:AseI n=1 Tax=Candidatus Omnitrophus magneticus TaxID=1609969 RepID=A0A0F0CTR2_9BACT|nr:AseI [Candidatus Omnitrophus magneticus]